MFMSTSSGRRVRGETQTSADSFCRAVGREFLNEITIQGPAPASVDPASAGAAEEEASVAPRKLTFRELTFLRGGAMVISALRNVWRFMTTWKDERSSDYRRAGPSSLRVSPHLRSQARPRPSGAPKATFSLSPGVFFQPLSCKSYKPFEDLHSDPSETA